MRPRPISRASSSRATSRSSPWTPTSPTDVYENDAGTLTLLSPGTADLPAVFKAATGDATRVFFRTAESLLPADTDTGIDLYERHGAALTLRAAGTGNTTTFFGGTVAGGDIVFFNSDEALLAVDGDATRDLYAVGPSSFDAAPTCTAVITPEICDNCVDDDGDGTVDRDDADCAPYADGHGAGLPDPKTLGKAALKCQKTVGKAGAKLAAATLKRLQACLGPAFACVQRQPGVDACVVKSAASKTLAGLVTDRAKLTAAIAKSCGPPALETSDLLAATGLGFGTEEDACGARGVAALASVDDLALCVAREHECRAEALAGAETPRAAELFALLGIDVATALPWRPGVTFDAGGAHLGEPKVEGKAAVKCQAGFVKAGAKFVKQKQGILQGCAGAVATCVQQKPTDPKCLPKARSKCGKLLAKLTAPGNGIEAKLAAAIAKSCGAPALGAAGVIAPAGLGLTVQAETCAAFGLPTLATLADVGACATRLHECRVDQLLQNQTPRWHELLDLGGVPPP